MADDISFSITTTSPELIAEIIALIRRGGTSTPPHSLAVANNSSSHYGNGGFTICETKILEQLKLGKSNKIIAFALGVSESAVKHHVRNIMRKTKATNRTEIVCRTSAL